MGKITGFMEIDRALPPRRPVSERLKDWRELEGKFDDAALQAQGARCMDCGIPFCHKGCPLGNIIPDWNDLIYRGRWKQAIERLHSTNNFPEFTGRICPAPCEEACVLNINDNPVTIKQIEKQTIDHALKAGWVVPQVPAQRSGKTVAIVGSGPAGLACAQQLARAGHLVTVFERDDRIGGLLRYGIPDFKMEKHWIDFRMQQMEAEGVTFKPGVAIGTDYPAERLTREFDAVVIAAGATKPRDLPVPGRELGGILFAMQFLPQQNKVVAGDTVQNQITASGKRVVILGGGDTGSDCLGTSNRQGATSVHQFELLPRPPDQRAPDNPWPQWPNIFRVSGAHEEGGERVYAVSTQRFLGDERGRVKALEAVKVDMVREGGRIEFKPVPGTEFKLDVDLVLLAMGFLGPERSGMLTDFGVRLTERGNVWRDTNWMTSVRGVFACGDMQRGQSLIVWAIAEGRSAARGVDLYLMGKSELPAPL